MGENQGRKSGVKSWGDWRITHPCPIVGRNDVIAHLFRPRLWVKIVGERYQTKWRRTKSKLYNRPKLKTYFRWVNMKTYYVLIITQTYKNMDYKQVHVKKRAKKGINVDKKITLL